MIECFSLKVLLSALNSESVFGLLKWLAILRVKQLLKIYFHKEVVRMENGTITKSGLKFSDFYKLLAQYYLRTRERRAVRKVANILARGDVHEAYLVSLLSRDDLVLLRELCNDKLASEGGSTNNG